MLQQQRNNQPFTLFFSFTEIEEIEAFLVLKTKICFPKVWTMLFANVLKVAATSTKINIARSNVDKKAWKQFHLLDDIVDSNMIISLAESDSSNWVRSDFGVTVQQDNDDLHHIIEGMKKLNINEDIDVNFVDHRKDHDLVMMDIDTNMDEKQVDNMSIDEDIVMDHNDEDLSMEQEDDDDDEDEDDMSIDMLKEQVDVKDTDEDIIMDHNDDDLTSEHDDDEDDDDTDMDMDMDIDMGHDQDMKHYDQDLEHYDQEMEHEDDDLDMDMDMDKDIDKDMADDEDMHMDTDMDMDVDKDIDKDMEHEDDDMDMHMDTDKDIDKDMADDQDMEHEDDDMDMHMDMDIDKDMADDQDMEHYDQDLEHYDQHNQGHLIQLRRSARLAAAAYGKESSPPLILGSVFVNSVRRSTRLMRMVH